MSNVTKQSTGLVAPGEGGESSYTPAVPLELTGNTGVPNPLEGWRFSSNTDSETGTRNLTGATLSPALADTHSRLALKFGAGSKQSITSGAGLADLRILGDMSFLIYIELYRSANPQHTIVSCGGGGGSLANSYLYELSVNSLGEIRYAHQYNNGASLFEYKVGLIDASPPYNALRGVLGFIRDGSDIHLCFGGKIVSTGTITNAATGGSNASFAFSSDAASSANPMLARAGEAWIWNVALNESQLLLASRAISPLSVNY